MIIIIYSAFTISSVLYLTFNHRFCCYCLSSHS